MCGVELSFGSQWRLAVSDKFGRRSQGDAIARVTGFHLFGSGCETPLAGRVRKMPVPGEVRTTRSGRGSGSGFSCTARQTPSSAFLGRSMAPHCEGRPGHDLLEQKAMFVIRSIFTYAIRLLQQFEPKNCPLNWNVPDAFGWTYAKRLLSRIRQMTHLFLADFPRLRYIYQ